MSSSLESILSTALQALSIDWEVFISISDLVASDPINNGRVVLDNLKAVFNSNTLSGPATRVPAKDLWVYGEYFVILNV